MKVSKSERKEALVRLHEIVKPGDTVYTILRHCSRSGMSRSISVVIGGTEPYDFSYLLPRIGVGTFDRDRGGVKVGGCGMDMGFSIVHNLGYALWPDGFDCIGEKCPSSDHVNGDRNYEPHNHKSGGCALKQRWL